MPPINLDTKTFFCVPLLNYVCFVVIISIFLTSGKSSFPEAKPSPDTYPFSNEGILCGHWEVLSDRGLAGGIRFAQNV